VYSSTPHVFYNSTTKKVHYLEEKSITSEHSSSANADVRSTLEHRRNIHKAGPLEQPCHIRRAQLSRRNGCPYLYAGYAPENHYKPPLNFGGDNDVHDVCHLCRRK
jgi:hypothetical protein